MKNPLLNKMKNAGIIPDAALLSESVFFTAKDIIPTNIPILNLAFSGDLNGGMVSGLTVIAGLPKSFKTLLGLYCLKAYFNKYEDAVALIYDSEFGITPQYMKMHDIDTSRIIHIPVEDLEAMKFDIMNRLKEISRGDHVFILIDSLGTMGSKKEIEDALSEKSVTDMTRAKSIRSILRMITPHMTMKDIPCIIINHVYQTLEIFAKTIVSGGTAVTYNANQVFIISRAQDKTAAGDLKGYFFTINIEKSRFTKEKSKFPLHITFDEGIDTLSGLLDMALDLGFITKPQKGKYCLTGETKEYSEEKIMENIQIWDKLLGDESFNKSIKEKYQLGAYITEKDETPQETIQKKTKSDKA